MRSTGVAYLLLLTLGLLGVHQFNLGNITRGLGYLFTIGFLGIGPLIDLFTLSAQVRKWNDSYSLAQVARRSYYPV